MPIKFSGSAADTIAPAEKCRGKAYDLNGSNLSFWVTSSPVPERGAGRLAWGNRRATVNHAVDRVVMLVLRRAGSLMGTARRCQEASGPRDEGLIWSV
jgi:hypothetical protein